MAPTGLLAEQHAHNFMRWFQPLAVRSVCLTGGLKSTERAQILSEIASGSAQVVIGTHALFQKEVTFSKLALVIIDEQHRFGVQQRLEFHEKGYQANERPHQLIMTATPIPRTLAMTAYADLDISTIDALPAGRKPITTAMISSQRREEVAVHVAQACQQQGSQAYWVCTLIEESEVLQCQAAEATAAFLAQQLPQLRLGLIHGRLKTAEKEAQMADFKAGNIHLLVATTVIEVGVDVPNASLMVIENAERLGLSQLHQLRGRVGRGTAVSHCVLLYQMPLSPLAKERLQILKNHQDGFEIARQDLALRGPGDVLGTRQAGLMLFRIADLLRDKALLPQVQAVTQRLLQEFPAQVTPLVARWIGEDARFGRV
jgi:ATP-dependent DNA helicase RecG